MPDSRGSRFILEVLFLLALAIALTLSDLTPLEIAGVMLLGWLVVALFEWAAWRGEPHYGSGLPPRYYVPRVNLPPAQPLEQVAPAYPDAGYPEARDEAPTWIAPAALRAEVLGDWPVALRETDEQDPWDVAELPPEPEGMEPEPAQREPASDTVEEPPVFDAEPESEPEPEPVRDDAEEQRAAEPQPNGDVVLPRAAQGRARYSLDPLADPPQKRRFGRGGEPDETAGIEVPARPSGVRPLPGRSTRDG